MHATASAVRLVRYRLSRFHTTRKKPYQTKIIRFEFVTSEWTRSLFQSFS